MSTGDRFPAPIALEAARRLIAEVKPFSHQLVICGSMRRLLDRNRHEHDNATAFLPEDTVGDLEIVCEAQYEEVPNPKYPLLETVLVNSVWRKLNALVNQKDSGFGRWTFYPSWGPKLRKVALALPDGSLIKCDFHCVSAASFGYKVALCTGDAGWNHLMVTSRTYGGLRPEHVRLEGLEVRVRDVLTPVLTEQAFFAAMEMPYTPPHKRTREAAERLHHELMETA